ncbi:MAG: hypothetical protein V8T86_07830 [Victivallis sp.]
MRSLRPVRTAGTLPPVSGGITPRRAWWPWQHLLEKGHRRIGWCANGDDVTTCRASWISASGRRLDAKNLGWDETIVPMRCNYLYSHGLCGQKRSLPRRTSR